MSEIPFSIEANYSLNKMNEPLKVEAPGELRKGTVEDVINFLLSETVAEQVDEAGVDIIEHLRMYMDGYRKQVAGEETVLYFIVSLKNRDSVWESIQNKKYAPASDLCVKVAPYILPASIAEKPAYVHLTNLDGKPEEAETTEETGRTEKADDILTMMFSEVPAIG